MKIKVILGFLALFLPKTAFLEEAVFINGFEDLPLMQGMAIIEDAGISFDSLSGSIIDVYVEALDVSPDDVFVFYKKTLPQLGWTFDKHEDKVERFYREGQVLIIEHLADSQPQVFRFEARPTL